MRYWLTPPDLYAALDEEFHFDYDPCPSPRPAGFDGLRRRWGKSNWVNPPFGTTVAPWVRKMAKQAGNSVLILPIPSWLHEALVRGMELRPIGTIRWRAIEDPT